MKLKQIISIFIILFCIFLMGGCAGKTEVPDKRQESGRENRERYSNLCGQAREDYAE